VSAVGPATQDFELPDIVSAGPPTAATPLVVPASEEIETRDLPATEPMEAAEYRRVTVA
jgi:exonuclease VII large subunit